MEENKTNEEKLSYDQLMNAAKIMQQRLVVAEQKLNMINLTAIRLEYLFKVLNNTTHFPEDFVKECAAEAMNLLQVKEEKEEKEETPETTEE